MQNTELNDSLKPEIEFLLACIRPQPWAEKERAHIDSLLKNEINWEDLIESALYHKCISLLYKSIVDNLKTDIPKDVLAKIGAIQKSIAIRGLDQSGSLAYTVTLLNETGVDVLPIKGPVLAQRLYGSYTMRSYGDIDILVRKQDIKKSLDILLENNYVLLPEGIPRHIYDQFLKHAYHGRIRDPYGNMIELHWELTGFYVSKGIMYNDIEPYLIETEFCGRPSLDLSDEMLVIYLCIHGIKHNYQKLDYICSIARLLQKAPSIDWQMVFDIGKRFKINRGLLFSLALVDNLFALPPSKIRDELSAHGPDFSDLAGELIRWNLTPESEKDTSHPLQKNALYYSTVFDSKMTYISFFLHSKIVPHTDEWESVKFPKTLFYFYFLKKMYRVFSLFISNRLHIMNHKMTNSFQKTFKEKK